MGVYGCPHLCRCVWLASGLLVLVLLVLGASAPLATESWQHLVRVRVRVRVRVS